MRTWSECEFCNKNQVCAICGVLCISLPIPIIVNNFNNIYEKSKIEEEIKAKKTKSSWEDSNRGECLKKNFQGLKENFKGLKKTWEDSNRGRHFH